MAGAAPAHPRNLASSAALAAEGQRSVLARLVACVEPDNTEIVAARLIAEFRSLDRLLSHSPDAIARVVGRGRSDEHTSGLQSLMRTSYAVLCLRKKNDRTHIDQIYTNNH